MTAFPQSLKSWRKARRFSQMDLALEADVSTRHISFLETGRARPSRDMIARLGDALDLPLDARNQMMVHAGFAPRYTRRAWNADDMAPIRDAVEHMLENHAPYPAIALDRDWTLMRMNIPAQALFGMLEINEGDSLLDVVLSDQMPDVIENWPEVAHHTAQRLRTESTAQGGNDRFDSAADVLSRVPAPKSRSLGPVVPAIYRSGPMRLALFATIAQFGTPEDLLLEDLKIELFFPADAQTDAALQAMSSG